MTSVPGSRPVAVAALVEGGSRAPRGPSRLANDRDRLPRQKLPALGRDPNDIELMMFAQANSVALPPQNFSTPPGNRRLPRAVVRCSQMIKIHPPAAPRRHPLRLRRTTPRVLAGTRGGRFYVDPKTGEYAAHTEDIHLLCKVETQQPPHRHLPLSRRRHRLRRRDPR